MRSKELLFLTVILLIGLSSALTSTIVVQTVPETDIMVSLLPIGKSYPAIQNFHETSDINGMAILPIDTTKEQFEIAAWIKENGKLTNYKKFDEIFYAGLDAEIKFYPSWYPDPAEIGAIEESVSTSTSTDSEAEGINDSETTVAEEEEEVLNETEEIIENETESDKVTALAISKDQISINTKTLIYIIGIIILAGIIFFVGKHFWKNRKPKNIKVTKLSEIKKENKEKIDDQEKKVEEAKKTYETEKEKLDKIKDTKKEKIEELKKKIEEDEDKLIKLRQGKDIDDEDEE